MSLGRSAIPIPVLRWSSAGVAPIVEAVYYEVGYEHGWHLADGQADTLLASPAQPDLTPGHEDTMLLADDQASFMEPS